MSYRIHRRYRVIVMSTSSREKKKNKTGKFKKIKVFISLLSLLLFFLRSSSLSVLPSAWREQYNYQALRCLH